MRLLIVIAFTLVSMAGQCQWFLSKQKAECVGPFETPQPNVRAGLYSPTGMGWIEGLLIDPKDTNTMYAGSNTGGLYKTTDHGAHWQPMHLDWAPITGVLTLEHINKRKVLIGTGSPVFPTCLGKGITSFNPKQPTFNADFKDSLNTLDFWDIARIPGWRKKYAAVGEAGIWTKVGRKQKWLLHKVEKGFLKEIISNPFDKNTLAAAGNRLLVSRNQGATWIDVTDKLTGFKIHTADKSTRIALSVGYHGKKQLMVSYAIEKTFYIDVSDNWGLSWRNLHHSSTVKRSDIHHNEIKVAPNDSNVIYLGTYRVYKSIDRGKSFKLITNPRWENPQFTHDDVRELVVLSDKSVYIGTDGGVFKTFNGGDTWQNLSGKGLTVTQFYGMDINKDGLLIGGTQDLSQMELRNDKWLNHSQMYADGGEVVFHPIHDSIVHVSRSGRLQKSESFGKNWKHDHPPSRKFSFLFPMVYDNQQRLYVGRYQVYRQENDKWTNISSDLGKFKYALSGLAFDHLDSGRMYMSFEEPTWNPEKLERKLYSSTDYGKNWTDITSHCGILAWRGISSMVLHDSNLYIGFKQLNSGNDNHFVYRSSNHGLDWTNISDGLKDNYINKLFYLAACKSQYRGLYAGTARGVFYFDDEKMKWHPVIGIPEIPVFDLTWNSKDQKLYIATYGAGIWRLY